MNQTYPSGNSPSMKQIRGSEQHTVEPIQAHFKDTATYQRHHVDSVGERLDQDIIQVIVANHAGSIIVIQGNQCLIKSISLFAMVIIFKLGTVACTKFLVSTNSYNLSVANKGLT